MHKVLVNCFVKLAQEKSVARLTDHLDMTIAVDWDVKQKNKQNKSIYTHMFSPIGNNAHSF